MVGGVGSGLVCVGEAQRVVVSSLSELANPGRGRLLRPGQVPGVSLRIQTIKDTW